MTTLRQAAEQALEWIAAKPDDRAISAGRMVGILSLALEADTKPCVCCGDGNSRLSVTRICDACGSEYAGQAEMDMAKQPAQQPLTEEQIMAIGRELGLKCRLGGNPNIDFDYARAIERAHGIKEES